MKVENPLCTTAEAAAFLGITRSYLYKLMMWRKVPYYKPRGKLCFFDKADLDEYNRRYRVQSEDELEEQSKAYMLRKRVHEGLL